MQRIWALFWPPPFFCADCPALWADGEPVSFRNDVMAVLSRAGCNMGACHGNLNGRGGFKLSLRGQDPDLDFQTLTRGMLARRLNPQQPEASLILAKAIGAVPHEGGLRFAVQSNSCMAYSAIGLPAACDLMRRAARFWSN